MAEDGEAEQGEAAAADGSADDTAAAPEGFDRWRRESSIGGIGTGIARGLHAVFAPPVDEVVIVAAVPGEPPDAGERMRVVLDPDDPTKSVAIMPGAQGPGPDEPEGGSRDA